MKSVRLLDTVAGLCMLVYAVLCMHSVVLMHQASKMVAALVVIILGMHQLVDCCYMPVLLRDGGTLIGAVLSTMIGMLLLFSPMEITVSVFIYIFGLPLIIFSVNKIAFANKLRFFGIFDYSWVIASGIMNILVATVFLTIPLTSIVTLNTALTGYSVMGGTTLLAEVITTKSMEIEDVQE